MSEIAEKKRFAVAAGGTGGHMFPAIALARQLADDGHLVHLITDDRGTQYADQFPGRVHVVPSETIRSKSPIALIKTFTKLGFGLLTSMALLRHIKPSVVIAFGGYPTLPPTFAAWALGFKTALHEQNALMGRANRLLSRYVSRIAYSFPDTRGVREDVKDKLVLTGLPVREAVIEAVAPYQAPTDDGPVNLLIFGGSQGARVLSEVVPGGLTSLDAGLRKRLVITQQCREEDEAQVRSIYEAASLNHTIAPFFSDLPKMISDAHLVISRAGASTVAELAVLGRPSVLIPLKQSLDGDQKANAKLLSDTGGAVVMDQDIFSSEKLGGLLNELLQDPLRLGQMADQASSAGQPDAVHKLKDLALSLAAE